MNGLLNRMLRHSFPSPLQPVAPQPVKVSTRELESRRRHEETLIEQAEARAYLDYTATVLQAWRLAHKLEGEPHAD